MPNFPAAGTRDLSIISENESQRWVGPSWARLPSAQGFLSGGSRHPQVAALWQAGRTPNLSYNLVEKEKTKHPHGGGTISPACGWRGPWAVICKGHFWGLPSCHHCVDSTRKTSSRTVGNEQQDTVFHSVKMTWLYTNKRKCPINEMTAGFAVKGTVGHSWCSSLLGTSIQ